MERKDNACPRMCAFTEGCIEDESAGIIEIPDEDRGVAFEKGYLDKGKNAFGSRPLCNVGGRRGLAIHAPISRAVVVCRVDTERAIFRKIERGGVESGMESGVEWSWRREEQRR